MNITRNKKWSALLIALWVLTLLTMISTVFFEKLYRFAQTSEGIENSNVAYYKALGIIEEVLYTWWVNKYTPWNIQNISLGSFTNSGSRLTAFTGATTVPDSGKWNSPYNTDYNTISLGEPVQLVIPENINWDNIYFEFKVPIIPGTTSSSTGIDSTLSNSWLILWTIASSWASLFASGETNIFKGSEINITNNVISNRIGTSNSGSTIAFKSFYVSPLYLGTNGANCFNFQCTLKLSLIQPILLTDWRVITFLDYRISGFPSSIPSQYMDIHAEWFAYWFLRSKDVKFPQITTNTALDFAVLQ